MLTMQSVVQGSERHQQLSHEQHLESSTETTSTPLASNYVVYTHSSMYVLCSAHRRRSTCYAAQSHAESNATSCFPRHVSLAVLGAQRPLVASVVNIIAPLTGVDHSPSVRENQAHGVHSNVSLMRS